jgi:hypothetical protein
VDTTIQALNLIDSLALEAGQILDRRNALLDIFEAGSHGRVKLTTTKSFQAPIQTAPEAEPSETVFYAVEYRYDNGDIAGIKHFQALARAEAQFEDASYSDYADSSKVYLDKHTLYADGREEEFTLKRRSF